MPFSPEMSAMVAEWRRKAASNELSREEALLAVRLLRQDRVGAHIASTTSRTKKAASNAPINTDALLAGLMGTTPAEPADDSQPG